MAYYLSKANEAIILPYIPLLRNATNNVKLSTGNPQRLEYILRNAAGTEKYSWIRNKFILRCREGYVLCSIKNPDIHIEDSIPTIETLVSFFDIANNLILNKPSSIRYTSYLLEPDEIEKLELLATNNNYTLEKNEDYIQFIKQ